MVYADDSEKDAVKFAEILERYHGAMRFLTQREDVVPSPSSRVTIYAVGSARQIKELVGNPKSDIAGFYFPTASGSRAFVPDIRVARGENDFSLTVLLHEYAHHFLLSTSRFAMPRWFNEGAAEFYASAKFEADGTVWIGRPAYHRGGDLAYADDVTVEQLLDSKLYQQRHGDKFSAFYGRAWALYHYLQFDESRKGQLSAYVRSIASGKSEKEAATATFGDLKQLEKDLDAYLRRSRLTTFKLPPEKLTSAAVKVATLSDGESAVLPLVIRSQRGVDREKALALLPEVRAVAANYPGDAAVHTALAEAEFDAGNDSQAIAAADKAIALDPARVNAYVQKGYALFRIASEAPSDQMAAAYRTAMKPFQALNAIENDHPLPLIYLYRSFTEQGRPPTELARHALERASQFAPYDRGLAFQTAMMHAREGKIALATFNLQAIAASPHGGNMASSAQKLLSEIGNTPEGTPWAGSASAQESDASDDGGT